MSTYLELLKKKRHSSLRVWLGQNDDSGVTLDFQQAIIKNAVRKGCVAIFVSSNKAIAQ